MAITIFTLFSLFVQNLIYRLYHKIVASWLSREQNSVPSARAGTEISKRLELTCGVSTNANKIRQQLLEFTSDLADLTLYLQLHSESHEELSNPPCGTRCERPPQCLANEIPNLRGLALHFTGGAAGVGQAHIVVAFTADLLNSASGLESLCVSGLDCYVDLLATVHETVPHLHKLKKLSIDRLGFPELHLLKQLSIRTEDPLQLQEFGACIAQNPPTEVDEVKLGLTELPAFLQSQAATLRSVTIKIDPSWLALCLPLMPELRSFRLSQGKLLYSALSFEGGSLGSTFPKLKRFEYDTTLNKILQGNGDEDLQALAHVSLSDLTLVTPTEDAKTCPDFYILAARFPALASLEIVVPDTLIRVDLTQIWTAFPQLTELTLRYHDNDNQIFLELLDNLLTGIPGDKMSNLEEEMEEQRPSCSDPGLTLGTLRELQARYKIKPGLSNLKNLRRFVLDDQEMAAMGLSDIGGYFGLALASPCMQHMEIRASDKDPGLQNSLSDECRQMIRSVFHPSAVIIL